MKRAGALLLVCLGAAWACSAERRDDEPRGAVGVFFGGQVQEREVVPVSPDRLPTLGFRVELPEAREEAAPVRWQIVRPGPAGRRVTELGSFEVPPGRSVFDQRITLAADSPLGTWNVRVTVGGRLVIDRALALEKSWETSPAP